MIQENKLWYPRPAAEWYDALPIGTGRLAAMVFGTLPRERLALNHEWFWTARHQKRKNRVVPETELEQVRRLLLAGKYEAGTIAANDAFSPFGRDSMANLRVDSYQPIGDLYVEFVHNAYAHYRRELDLDAGQVRVQYEALGTGRMTRDYLASLHCDRLVVHIQSAENPFSCSLWLDRIFDPECELDFSVAPELLQMRGFHKSGINFQTDVRILADSGAELVPGREHRLVVENATEVLIILNIGTSANGRDAAIESACSLAAVDISDLWQQILTEHRQAYRKFYRPDTLQLDLPLIETSTDRRIEQLKQGGEDPGLMLLQTNFARYLLAACSATGELPANLQGKWNENLKPAWNCDYHLNINLQMNYWCAPPAGLKYCENALFSYVERKVESGKKAARDLFSCDGIWLAGSGDAWDSVTLEGYGWSIWTGAAPWLAQHFWWHYEFTQDLDFLRDRAYPFICQVAAFYQSFLLPDADGIYQFVPSQSPENRFREAGDLPISLCVSSAMDIELAHDLLTHAVAASEILNCDEEQRHAWQEMLDHLPPLKIDTSGRLMEWNEPFTEVEPGHRHISHLFGLYPGEQITEYTPDLFAAAARSLDYRLAQAGAYTGWSRAWTACCLARLGRGDDALTHLKALITEFSTASMLDLHPPRIFQIDGNLGSAAAVLEMLLQSHGGIIRLLPALPAEWPNGRACDLRARGGFRIDIQWQEGQWQEAHLTATVTGPCKVKDPQQKIRVQTTDKQPVSTCRWTDGQVFTAKAGITYRLLPS